MSGSQEIVLKGYPICPGIAIGKAFYFSVAEENIPEFSIADEEIDLEVERYYHALVSSQNDIQVLCQRLEKSEQGEIAKILQVHLQLLKDPVMTEEVEKQIRNRAKNTEYVFTVVMGEVEKKFRTVPDRFFQERIQDFQDISRRILRHLRKRDKATLADIQGSCIVFAHELSPSDTAEANTQFIEAFVTRTGSETSHVAITARARKIPFVSNVEFPDLTLFGPQLVIVDGKKGRVIFNPQEATLKNYQQLQQALGPHRKITPIQISHAQTKDGLHIQLSANIEMAEELDILEEAGSLSVGLFRSEYLLLANNSLPTEEEQFIVYRSLVEKVDVQTSVIRTFDLGGDKFSNLHPYRFESNPFLGLRAIRLMLQEPSFFKSQLRAILRASAFGQVSILFPMISDIQELRQAKALVEEAKKELAKAFVPFARNIPIGCMIEVPSAAVTVDILSHECDFFSIGTNDLVQYTLAVDRGHAQMSYLYQPCHPSILRLIDVIVQKAHAQNKPVTVCGEVAADPKFVPLLVGLGVDELSISLPLIAAIKTVICAIDLLEAKALAQKVRSLHTAQQVQAVLDEFYDSLKMPS